MSTIRAVVRLARDRNLTFLAAAIAYYAFVSVIPLVLLAVAAASLVGGQALADRVTNLVSGQLSASGQQMVTEVLTSSSGRGAASVVGVLALLWSGLKLFRGLDQAFDELYADDVESSLLDQIRDGLVVVWGIALALALVIAVGTVLSMLSVAIPYANTLGSLVLVVVLTGAFLPIYYVLPPQDESVRAVLPGAAVAAIGWVLLQAGFRVYAANAGQYAAYGVIGAVLLFVTWLYFGAIVVLLGAAVNAVREGVRVDCQS